MAYIKGKRVALSDKPTEESIAFAERCWELFEYREDGVLIWKVNRRGGTKAGSTAGTLGKDGYLRLAVDSVRYTTHQIVFLLHHEYIPKTIDHIDRARTNNRIENLRYASARENVLNRSNTSETPNIYRNGKGFQVKFMFEGKRESFGTYKTLAEAIAVRDKIANDLDNWQLYKPIKTKDKPPKYIYKNGKGFLIQKAINGVSKHFGTYKTIEDAITARDELEANSWNQN